MKTIIPELRPRRVPQRKAITVRITVDDYDDLTELARANDTSASRAAAWAIHQTLQSVRRQPREEHGGR